MFIKLENFKRSERTSMEILRTDYSVPEQYNIVVEDMYGGVQTIGVTQMILKWKYDYTNTLLWAHFLFDLKIDEVTKGIEWEVPWCMLFAHDIFLVDEWSNKFGGMESCIVI